MSTPFQITVDCVDADRMADFWAGALGYAPLGPPPGFNSWDEFTAATGVQPPAPGSIRTIIDPTGVGPTLKFVEVLQRRRREPGFNFELRPGDDAAKTALIEHLEHLGARKIARQDEPQGWWVVMADPEGNEFCVL